jgi:hypothetical protein
MRTGPLVGPRGRSCFEYRIHDFFGNFDHKIVSIVTTTTGLWSWTKVLSVCRSISGPISNTRMLVTKMTKLKLEQKMWKMY